MSKKSVILVSLSDEDLELIRAAAFTDRAKSPNRWIADVAVAVARLTPPTPAPSTPLTLMQARKPPYSAE